MPILAAATPGDCFFAAIEAVRIAITHMIPVMLLTDGYLANGAEPWQLPDLDAIPPIDIPTDIPVEGFHPYNRDPDTLARPWALPGTPGLEHRLGGLEKQDITGNVSYDPDNHDHMTRLRQERVDRIARDLPPAQAVGDAKGLLVVSWGGTYGAVTSAVSKARLGGLEVAHLHLRWLNPFPPGLGEVLARYDHILVPELNRGQLAHMLRGTFGVKVVSHSKVQGKPFTIAELLAHIQTLSSDVQQREIGRHETATGSEA